MKKVEKNHMQAFDEYKKRLSRFCTIKLVPVKDYNTYSSHVNPSNATIIVIPGKDTLSSPDFSNYIEDQFHSSSNIDFFVCSKDYSESEAFEALKKQAMDQTFSISCFDMNEELSAVVLAEQIYRAYTIQNNIAYHK